MLTRAGVSNKKQAKMTNVTSVDNCDECCDIVLTLCETVMCCSFVLD